MRHQAQPNLGQGLKLRAGGLWINGPPALHLGHHWPMAAPTSRPGENLGLFGPMLAPGAMLLRRDAQHLQIGTAPGVVVAETPGLARVLRLLDGSQTEARLAEKVARDIPEFTENLSALLNRLLAHGAVVQPPPKPRRFGVAVRSDQSTERLAQHLRTAFGPPGLAPEVEVLLSAGEISRSNVESLWLAQITHLPVVIDERRVRIGPLVIPQVTPCLNCLDESITATNPAWAALLPQFERYRRLPLSISPQLLFRISAEVANQIDYLSRGERAPTVGAVLSVGPAHDRVELQPVPFASGCECLLLAA